MRAEEPNMSITTYLRRELREARLRPGPAPSPDTETDAPAEPDGGVFEFLQLPPPALGLDLNPFEFPPSTNPNFSDILPAEADPDLLEIPPAVIGRFVLTLPDGKWPITREEQTSTVDMIATLSSRPDCRQFRYLRLV